jgi:hypothetical protein
VLAALALSFVLVGFCTPVEQSAEVSRKFNCSRSDLWLTLTNIREFASIKEDVKKVEILNDGGNKWIEISGAGVATEVEILEATEGEKLVLKITDPNLKVEKRREYTLFGNQEHSMLSIKEYTKVEKLLLRSTLALSGSKQSIKKEINGLAQHMSF